MKLGKGVHGTKRVTRSRAGNIALFLVLAIMGIYSVLPIYLAANQSLKPLNELFIYPPRMTVSNPTLDNFRMLFDLGSSTGVPFLRYVFNTVLVTVVGTVGNVLVCSLAAYPLAKHKAPGRGWMFEMVVMALMFNAMVADVVNYLIIAGLGWIDTYLAIIVPACASPLGLFLMRQFMIQIPDSIIESAKIDGAGEWRIFFKIIMPSVKPAWLTLSIFAFLTLWNGTFTTYIYSERMKTLPYALNQIVAGGITRAGAGAAVTIVMMAVPVVFFMCSQSKIIETMAASGIKE